MLLSMTLSNDACAQVSDEVREAAMRDFHGDDMTGKDGPLAKAGLDLLMLYHAYTSEQSAVGSASAGGENALVAGVDVRDGRVTVDAVANANVQALKADLKALGMTRAATAGPMVSGRFPIAKVPDLARLETLRSVRAAQAATQSAAGEREVMLGDTNTVPPEASDRARDGEANDASEKASAVDTEPPAPRLDEADTTAGTSGTVSPESPVSKPSPDDVSKEGAIPAPHSDEGASSNLSVSRAKDAGAQGGPAGVLLLVLAASLILFLDV
jgi:hypothetical protein